MTLRQKISALLKDLTLKQVTRHGEDETRLIVKCSDSSPLYPIIRKLHDGRLPHDFVFATVRGALETLKAYPLGPSSLHDSINEVSDGLVDTYRKDLLAWSQDFSEWIDEAQSQGLVSEDTGFEDRMRAGQFLHIQTLVTRLIEEIENLDMEEEPC